MEHAANRSELSKRADWHNFSDNVQQDVNETLAQVSENVDFLNSRLAKAYENSMHEYSQVGVQIIKSLDELWQHHGSLFFVVGEWQYPYVEQREDGLQVHHVMQPAFNEAVSDGFMTKLVEQNGELVPKVGLSFVTREATVHTPMMKAFVKPLSFAEVGQVSLQFMRPRSNEVVSSSIEEVVTSIQRADQTLNNTIGDASHEFYRQDPQHQDDFFMSLIDSVESVMPDPQTPDRLMAHDIIAKEIFFKNPSTQTLVPIGMDGGKQLQIDGEVVGVTIPDIMHNGHGAHYTSPEQLIATYTGISLIVRPTTLHNFDLSEYGNPNIIVPLRDSQYGLKFA